MKKRLAAIILVSTFILTSAFSFSNAQTKPITRSEFALKLHKALDIQLRYFKETDIKEYFSDVKNNTTYASSLYDLVTVNIVDFKGKFKPNSILTKEEMIHFIMNAYKYKMGDKYKQIKILSRPYADKNNINPSYMGDITIAEYIKIINREKNNMFNPKDKVTESLAVDTIKKLTNILDKENIVVNIQPSFNKTTDAFKMKLSITNESKVAVTIKHTSGQKFDFGIYNSKNESLYMWSMDKSFVMAISETVIKPGKTVVFESELPISEFNKLIEKPAYMKAFIVGSSKEFSVNAQGYRLDF